MFELALWQWVGIFALAGVVLVRAGIGLARAGDEIATRTGVGSVSSSRKLARVRSRSR
jgi:hypothetical protein